MKDDLVDELRLAGSYFGARLPREAADEIERLRARVAELEAALNEMAGV